MLMILKIALLMCSLPMILYAAHDFAATTPLLMTAGALLIWWLDSKEPQRLFVWGALLAGIAVAGIKGAPFMLTGMMAAALLIAVDLLARRRLDDDPPASWLFGAALLAGVAAFGLGARSEAAGSLGNPTRIVTIGDSLSSGLPGESWQPWPFVLANSLGVEVENFAHPGDTLDSSYQRWEHRVGPGRWNPADRTWEPDLIIVVLGGNDILRRAGRAEVERGLRRWADLLKQQGRPVLFVSVPGAVISDGYAGVWRDVAKEYGFASMNERALRTILTTPAMTTDGIHFNARGANHFAEAVEKRIRGG